MVMLCTRLAMLWCRPFGALRYMSFLPQPASVLLLAAAREMAGLRSDELMGLLDGTVQAWGHCAYWWMGWSGSGYASSVLRDLQVILAGVFASFLRDRTTAGREH